MSDIPLDYDKIHAIKRGGSVKRLAEFVLRECAQIPTDFEADLKAVLRGAGEADESLLSALDRLILHLDKLLAN